MEILFKINGTKLSILVTALLTTKSNFLSLPAVHMRYYLPFSLLFITTNDLFIQDYKELLNNKNQEIQNYAYHLNETQTDIYNKFQELLSPYGSAVYLSFVRGIVFIILLPPTIFNLST